VKADEQRARSGPYPITGLKSATTMPGQLEFRRGVSVKPSIIGLGRQATVSVITKTADISFLQRFAYETR
jgi:hypothetical protein